MAIGSDDAVRAWRRVGRAAGYIAAAALLAGTVLFLLDALNALGAGPDFHDTGQPLQDEANFWVAEFAHQHHILWDILLRDTLFPLAFVTLIVLMLAVRALAPSTRPEAQLLISFFLVGGTISALSDLIYLGATDFWRDTGWNPVPAERMVAVGRDTQALNALTRWPEAAGFVLLAAGLGCLGLLCRQHNSLPSRLALAAYLEALLLLGIAIAGAAEMDTAYNIFSLLTGAIVGPLVAGWLGWHLGTRTETAAQGLALDNNRNRTHDQ